MGVSYLHLCGPSLKKKRGFMTEVHVFPKWFYHPEKEALIVRSQEQLEALGKGWVESPADFPKPDENEPPAVEAAETYHEHQAQWESKEEKKSKGKRKGKSS